MARVEVAPSARDSLNRMIADLHLPSGTRDLVRERLRQLQTFPESAPARDEGRWAGYRALVGPSSWLIIVYRFIEPEDIVQVVAMIDARQRDWTSNRVAEIRALP